MHSLKIEHVTADEAVKLIRRFFQLELHDPEISFPNSNYTHNPRNGHVFGDGVLIGLTKLPSLQQLKLIFHSSQETAICVAALDEDDVDRITMLIMQGECIVTVYDTDKIQDLHNIFTQLRGAIGRD